MNVLHVTRPQADAIADGTLTLAPADGQRCDVCPPVPVAAAPVGTITEEDFDG